MPLFTLRLSLPSGIVNTNMASQSPAKRSVRLHLVDPKSCRSRQKSRSMLNEDLSHISLPSEAAFERKSKRRAEALAGFHLPETEAIAELRLQLLAKDRYLEELNERLVQCTGKMKAQERDSVHQKERLINQLMKEKGDLLVAVQMLQKETQRLINSQIQSSVPSITLQDQALEAYRQEIDALKGELAAKDTISEHLKQDLGEMSEIVTNLTRKNAELNSKMTNLTLEIEEKAKTSHKMLTNMQHLEEVEKALAETITDKQNLEDQITKMTEKTLKLEEFEQTAARVSTDFASLESTLPSEFALRIEHLRGLLAPFQVETVKKLPDIVALKNKVRQLEVELRAANRDQSRQSKNEAELQARLFAQEAEHSDTKASMLRTTEELRSTIETLQSGFHNFANRYDELGKKYVEKCAELQIAQGKIGILQSSIANTQNAAISAAKAEAKAQLTLKEAHLQISVMQIGKTTVDAALQLRENRVKEGAARLKALSEEVWKRDSLILKKTAEVISLQEQVTALHMSLLQHQMRSKLDISHSARNRTAESRSKLPQIALNPSSYALKMRFRSHQSKSMVFSGCTDGGNDLQQAFTALMSKAIDILSRCPQCEEVPCSVASPGVEQALDRVIEEVQELLADVTNDLPTTWLPPSLQAILCPNTDTFPVISLLSYLKSLPAKLSRLSSHSEHSIS